MARLTGKNALICGDSRNILTATALPFDATGYDIRFTVRARGSTGNDDSNALISKTSTDGITVDGNNIMTIALTDTDTRVDPGKYLFDIQFESPDGFVSSTKAQEIEFIADVTKEV